MPESQKNSMYIGEHLKEVFSGEWGIEKPRVGFEKALVVRSTEICDDGKLELSTAVTRFVPSSQVNQKFLCNNDILIEAAGGSTDRPVGRPAIIKIESDLPPVLSSNFVKTLRFDENALIHSYAIHALRHLYFQPKFGVTQQKTTGIINLKFKELEKLSIFAPREIIQQKIIADILDTIDDAIIKSDALITKHEQVKLGLLDDLVAAPAQIAERQAPNTLADLVESISSGCSVNADDRPPTAGEYGVLKTSAVSNGRFRPIESKAVWPREVNRLKCPVTAGLILFSRMNTPQLVGENAYVEEDHPGLFLPDRLWAIRVKDDPEILPQWVAAILQTRQARAFITGEATGTSGSMKNIARTSLLRMRLRQLPESDQRRAVEAIGAAQLQLDVLRTERDKLAALRNGLRDDLLTGRVSVEQLTETATSPLQSGE